MTFRKRHDGARDGAEHSMPRDDRGAPGDRSQDFIDLEGGDRRVTEGTWRVGFQKGFDGEDPEKVTDPEGPVAGMFAGWGQAGSATAAQDALDESATLVRRIEQAPENAAVANAHADKISGLADAEAENVRTLEAIRDKLRETRERLSRWRRGRKLDYAEAAGAGVVTGAADALSIAGTAKTAVRIPLLGQMSAHVLGLAVAGVYVGATMGVGWLAARLWGWVGQRGHEAKLAAATVVIVLVLGLAGGGAYATNVYRKEVEEAATPKAAQVQVRGVSSARLAELQNSGNGQRIRVAPNFLGLIQVLSTAAGALLFARFFLRAEGRQGQRDIKRAEDDVAKGQAAERRLRDEVRKWREQAAQHLADGQEALAALMALPQHLIARQAERLAKAAQNLGVAGAAARMGQLRRAALAREAPGADPGALDRLGAWLKSRSVVGKVAVGCGLLALLLAWAGGIGQPLVVGLLAATAGALIAWLVSALARSDGIQPGADASPNGATNLTKTDLEVTR